MSNPELELMQERFIGDTMQGTEDLPRFPGGVGVIEPTDKYTDGEVAESVERSQQPVEDPAVVCMDERRSLKATENEGAETEPVREKVAGGNLNTFLVAAAAINWSGFSGEARKAGPKVLMKEAGTFLVSKLKEKLGAHRHAKVGTNVPSDEERKPNATGCGAIDKGSAIDQDTAEHAMDGPVVDQAKIDLGDLFNIDHWKIARDGFAQMAEDPEWVDWDRSDIQDEVDAHGGVVETLDASGDAFAEDEDPNREARKGHWAQAAKINSDEGYSNDRDRAAIPAFQVDVAPMIRMARAGATEEEFSLLLHAMVMRQYFTTYRLTHNMRIIR